MTADNHMLQAWLSGWRPDADLTVSSWADERRVLPQKAAAEPGPWRTDRTPYLREIMDALSPQDRTERVVFMAGAQVGKTECGNNWIGYVIDHAPGPMLMVQPTVMTAERVSKQRLAPMIDASPTLREKVAGPRSRDAGNTMFVKEFPGGVLLLTGANSAVGLRSMPIRFLFCDEVDAYPHDVEGEGDPVSLAEKRTTTFSNRKVLLTSTPTIKGLSRIEREFLRSDQRYYFLPCPHCGHMQPLRWGGPDAPFGIKWPSGNPQAAVYLCEACAAAIEERHKTAMLATGQWRPTASGDGKTRGYHLSGLYSPLGWKSWGDIAEEFLASKPYRDKLKTWVNTVLGESWEDDGDRLDANALSARLEPGERGRVPDGAAVLVATVDVQPDRLEAKIKAFGAGEESWLVDYEIMWGATAADDGPWRDLDEWLARPRVHAKTAQRVPIALTLVDSGDGNSVDAVYDYVKARQHLRVFASKGRDMLSRPGLAMDSAAKGATVRLFLLATHAAKDRIFARLRLREACPGFIHLPEWVPEQYLDQLTAEKKVLVENKRTGAVKQEYVKSGRNEALDLEVMALCGLFILQNVINPALYRDLGRLAAALSDGQQVVVAPRAGRRVRNPGGLQ